MLFFFFTPDGEANEAGEPADSEPVVVGFACRRPGLGLFLLSCLVSLELISVNAALISAEVRAEPSDLRDRFVDNRAAFFAAGPAESSALPIVCNRSWDIASDEGESAGLGSGLSLLPEVGTRLCDD